MLTFRVHEKVEKYDLTLFLILGQSFATEVCNLFSRDLVLRSTQRSRWVAYQNLKHGLGKFLVERKANDQAVPASLRDIGTVLLQDFVTWQNQQRNERKGTPWTKVTKIHRMGSVHAILMHAGKVMEGVSADIVPRNAWGNERATEPGTKPLEDERLKQLGQWCERRTLELMAEVVPLLDAMDKAEKQWRLDKYTFPAVAIRLLRHYDGNIPQRKFIEKDESLNEQIREFVRVEGIRSVMKCVGPTCRELMAPLYFLELYSAYNEQPLRDLHLSDFWIEPVLGGSVLLMQPYKTRSGTIQPRSWVITNESLHPADVLNFVQRWTKRLRSKCPPSLANYLFLYAPRNRKDGDQVRSLATEQPSSDFVNAQMWVAHELGMTSLGFRSIRLACAEMVGEGSGGDPLMISALLGHKSIATGDQSYSKSRTRLSKMMSLASATQARQRYLETEGKYDPRDLPGDDEASGVTPGFSCLDPLDSPFPGQIKGRPCTAFPWCPACPLGQPIKHRPRSLACLWQLRDELIAAEVNLGMPRWQKRYGSLFGNVNEHIASLESGGHADAARAVRLPPFPELE